MFLIENIKQPLELTSRWKNSVFFPFHLIYKCKCVSRARLHQASASTRIERCDDTGDTALIEINGVVTKEVATPSPSDSIDFNENCITGVTSALMPVLGIKGPLDVFFNNEHEKRLVCCIFEIVLEQ